MSSTVCITSYKYLFPGNDKIGSLLKTLLNHNTQIEFESVEFNGTLLGEMGILKIEDTTTFFPPKPELKIMRKDVLAAVISIQSLLSSSGIHKKKDLKNLDLYIANGAFIENFFDKNSRFYRNIKRAYEIDDPTKRQSEFYRVSLPLLGLNTLTNATESYSAQFTGVKGENTTFGNTSMSGYYALKTAIVNITEGKTNAAIVGASNCSHISSFLTNKNYTNKTFWKESPGSVFLILESEKSAIKNNRTILAKINSHSQNYIIPKLIEKKTNDFESFTPLSNYLIYSDPYERTNNLFSKWDHTYTLEANLGNTGAASVLINIASAIELLSETDSVDCLDTDMFHRSSFINLSKPNE